MEMKQFVRENVVDLGLAGDIRQFQESLSTDSHVLHWEQMSPDVIRVNFSNDQDFSQQLNRLLELVCRSPVELLSIRSGGEIEDAFLKRLEEDRMKGFNRVFDNRPSTQTQGMWPSHVLPEERVNGVPEVAEEQKV